MTAAMRIARTVASLTDWLATIPPWKRPRTAALLVWAIEDVKRLIDRMPKQKPRSAARRPAHDQ